MNILLFLIPISLVMIGAASTRVTDSGRVWTPRYVD